MLFNIIPFSIYSINSAHTNVQNKYNKPFYCKLYKETHKSGHVTNKQIKRPLSLYLSAQQFKSISLWPQKKTKMPTHPTHSTSYNTYCQGTNTPHQRARCLKFSPSLPTIQINNRRNAEEAYYAGEECPLIELPSHWRGWGWGAVREKGTRLFHALLTRSPKLLNVKRHFSICYCR